ncbi:MAG: type II secretion system protein [Candidatus Gastranaerophilales bacterium]|nr:type II secretion system protein [Candidatus Gastranaerophilales bacterium]
MKHKFAFTLAETMIVLVVIGVLSAVLIPTAMRSKPDENILKFKNGYNALSLALRELVSSDKYYIDGDLGVRSDGVLMSEWETNPEQRKFFCLTLADMMSTKSVDCDDANIQAFIFLAPSSGTTWNDRMSGNPYTIENEYMQEKKVSIDSSCAKFPFTRGVKANQIVTSNGVWYYDPSPATLFGLKVAYSGVGEFRVFSPPYQVIPTFHDVNNLDIVYKAFCMDIDGVPENATADDCVNECPFGFGIRADGKILTGAKADEWLEKSAQD